MTRWVRWRQAWHVIERQSDPTVIWTRCGRWEFNSPTNDDLVFSDFEPVEDECRQCRRVLDGGKA